MGSTPTRITNLKGDCMSCKSITFVGVLIVSVFLLSGCGQNIFDSFVDIETDNVETLLDDAKTTADYQKALTKINEQLADVSIDDTTKQTLLINKAEAIAGANDLPDLFALVEVMKEVDDSSIDTTDVNLIEKVADLIGTTDTATIQEVASVLNLADGLSISSVSLSNQSLRTASSNKKLDADQQLLRGIYNLLAAVKNIDTYFIVNRDGSLTVRNATSTFAEAFNKALYPDGLAVNATKTSLYADRSKDAFTKAGVFDSEQMKQIDDLDQVIDNIETIESAYRQSDPSVTIDGTVYNISTDSNLKSTVETFLKTLTK